MSLSKEYILEQIEQTKKNLEEIDKGYFANQVMLKALEEKLAEF